MPHSALALGFGGALPFIMGALLTLAGPPASVWASTTLIVYGAVILAFLGGVQWGLAMASRDASLTLLGASVIPALLGWGAAMLGGRLALMVLAATFVLVLLYDLRTARQGRTPEWYPSLRWPLTMVVVGCLLLAAIGA